MGFRNPFRITLDEDDVAYVSDYSPDSQTSGEQFRGPAGTGRVRDRPQAGELRLAALLQDRPGYYKWDFETGAPLPTRGARASRLRQPEPRAAERRPAGSRTAARRSSRASSSRLRSRIRRSGTRTATTRSAERPCRARRASPATDRSWTGLSAAPGGRPARARGCSPSCSRVASARTAPRRTTTTRSNPNPTKFPPYWDGAFILGEFTQDTLREVRLDSQNRVFKINNTLPVRAGTGDPPTRPFLCDNPMDMEFGRGRRRSTCSPTATGSSTSTRTPRWSGSSTSRAFGLRLVSITQPRRAGRAADGRLHEHGERPRPGRLDPLRVGLRRQRLGRLDRPEPVAHVHGHGPVRRQADGLRLERQEHRREHDDHGRQHRADGDRQHPGRRAGSSPSATTSRSS